MSAQRLSIVLLALASTIASDTHAQAGRFCDWLFGRNQSPYVVGYTPYAVGYTPYATGATPYAASYTPYAAGYAPTVMTQAATMPGTQPVATNPLSTGGPVNLAAINGAYQAQRPSYDNPSVYTGMPVIMAPGPQTTFRLPINNAAPAQPLPTVSAYRPFIEARQQAAAANVPIARVLRGGAAATSNPFYGTGNLYPNNYQAARYQSAYASPGIAGTTIPGTPLAAANVAPLFPNDPPYQPRVGGLARFFGSFWGTNYRTSYYRAPITYYRPVTSVDPLLGTTVTVQQPCTSTVQQLQRTPYDSLFAQGAAPTATMPMPGADCSTPGAGCSTPAASPYLGGAAVNTTPLTGSSVYGAQPQYGGVGQVGGITSPSDQSVTPIPSTIDPGYQYQPNTQPLQGNPNGAGDFQQIPQPELKSIKPAIEGSTTPQPAAENSEDDESFWGRRDREDKTAVNSLHPTKSAQSPTHSYSDLRPIEAPSDYQSPFRGRSNQEVNAARPSTSPVTQKALTAPPLLPSTRSNDQYIDLGGSTSAATRISVPVREATMTRPHAVEKPQQPKREYGGWLAN